MLSLRHGFSKRIVKTFEVEEIDYMIVGGFAMSYYNRFRYTADIDCVVQMYIHDIEKIIKHFPEWIPHLESLKDSAKKMNIFIFTDYADSGVKFDIMPYQDSEYNWIAFGRRKKVDFWTIECFISAAEDLILAKLKWYELSQSAKQLEDVKFLLKESELNQQYLTIWADRLKINRHGLF